MKQLLRIVFSFLLPAISFGQNGDDTLGYDCPPVVITAEKPISSGELWRRAMSPRAENARITVFNKTNTHLDSVYFAHKLIGSIDSDSSVTFLISGKIIMENGTPCSTVNAKAHLDQKKSYYQYYCDSRPYTMKTGTYSFDIVKMEIGDEYFFAWRVHNEQ